MTRAEQIPDRQDPPPPLTVAHVIHSLGAGGAESMLVELARVAPSAGLRLVVVGLSDAVSDDRADNRMVPQLREHGAVVYELHSGRYDPSAVLGLTRVLRDERVDVVHTHLKHADVVGGVAARLARLPSVSTLHVIDIPSSRPHAARVRAAVFARRHLAGMVIALSSAQLRWYREHAGPDAPITLLPNGIEEPTVTRNRAEVRSEMGVADDAVLAVCVSLMRPEKGHADLLEAVRLLPADLPLVVALAGDGPLLDNVSAAVASDPLLRERVRVLGFRRDVADLIAAADFVVQPSLEDALPTTLISALAGARPVVATDVGGIPDVVGPGCGVLVEEGHPAVLSAGIAGMTEIIRSEPDAAADMRRAARQRYERHFSAGVWVRNLRAVYEGVAGAPGTARSPGAGRRIALVEFPPSGGLYQFALQLGEGLARAGENVDLVTGPAPELDSREAGCRVRSILPTWHPAAGGDAPSWWRRARRVVRAGRHTLAWGVLISWLTVRRPDVVMWSEWRFPTDGWGVHLVRKVLPKAVLGIVAHEPRPLVEQPGQSGLYKTSGTMYRALARAFADLDVVFVLGESARQVVSDTWPVTAPVQVIPHGDEQIFRNGDLPGAETTGPVALSFGTITAYKGVDTLCQAWPAVRARIPDAELVIAGALSADVDAGQLHDQVAGLPGASLNLGYVPVPDVASYFGRARCVVLPYKRSSQSGVAHLAYTMSRPVVATKVGDIPDVVRDGVTGLLVPPDDPEALADALVRLLDDPQLAAAMGEAGARSLAQGASWDEVAARVRAGLPMSGG